MKDPNKLNTQEVFLLYAFENCVIRSHPENGYFIKYRNGIEIPAQVGSAVLTDALLEGEEITRKEYSDY